MRRENLAIVSKLRGKPKILWLGVFLVPLVVLFAMKFYWIPKVIFYSDDPFTLLSKEDFYNEVWASKTSGACATFGSPVVSESILDMPEASGVAITNLHKDRLYHVNDSGNESKAFLFNMKSMVEEERIKLPESQDIEAMDQGPCGNHHCIYVADTGSNFSFRKSLRLFRFREGAVNSIENLELKFEDGVPDIEAMAVHPSSGGIYLFSKELISRVFYIDPNISWGSSVEARLIDNIRFKKPTGASFSPDGKFLYLINYRELTEFTWPESSLRRLITHEKLFQVEALAVLANGSIIYTSEKSPLRSDLKNLAAVPCKP